MRNKEMADILSKQYAQVFSEPISPDAQDFNAEANDCLLYTSPSPRDRG